MTSAQLNALEMQKPAALVRSAETEQQMDIRLFKERYGAGKRAFEDCASLMARIYERGEWKSDGLSWGPWAEKNLCVSKSYAYSIVTLKNPATSELIKHYQSQVVSPVVDLKPQSVVEEKVIDNARTEAQKPHGQMPIPASLDLPYWTKKILDLFEAFPKSQLYNKLTPEKMKRFDDCLASFYSVLSEFIPQSPVKEKCNCGCALSPKVCHILFEAGVPSIGLTVGEGGFVMGLLSKNEWKLPGSFAYLRNPGEWLERKWRKK